MKPSDLLLAWASERGAGSWHDWREASEAVGTNPAITARNFSALGHVEFDWTANRFCCTPPTSVLIPRSSGSVIVTGARPTDLRSRLQAVSDDENSPYDIYFHSPLTQEDGPETWLIEAEIDDLATFCDATGLTLEVDAGRRIAQLTPVASIENAAEADQPDDRFPREWVNPRGGSRSSEGGDPQENGLWLVSEWRRKAAFIRRDGEWYRVPVREYGVYLAYPQIAFMRYRAREATLEIDNFAPLPPLLARAATLQSGRLPMRTLHTHSYLNIDHELALLIAERLRARVDLLS